VIPRIPVDLAIERWLRALERAEGCRSTSALLAQAQELGCTIHGGGRCVEPALCGLVAAERAVRLLSDVERRVLRAKYGTRAPVEQMTADGGAVVSVVTRLRSDVEVGDVLGLRATQVRRVLKHARAKVWRAMRFERVRQSR
jgi:hypothetical protein